MKAPSVRQPWAGLIVDGVEDVENRSRPTSFRKRICVHAGLEPDLGPGVLRLSRHQTDYGAVIGTVEIIDCARGSKSPLALRGMWHWVLADARPLRRPVPFPGKLGFFEVPDELLPAHHRG
ncbi:MAG: ASCH domain-containing protein [Candidatus Dormibacteria bacterium]